MYRKIIKGSDSFLAKAFTQMPSIASGEIVFALNAAHAEFVVPHQLLCNLNPVLGKPSEPGQPPVQRLTLEVQPGRLGHGGLPAVSGPVSRRI